LYSFTFSHCSRVLFLVPFSIPPPTCLREGDIYLPHLPSLRPQVSQGLVASFLTKARSSSPPVYMCWASDHGVMLPRWWLSLWDLLGTRLVETAGMPMGLPSPSYILILPLISL
jgi:H+/Cl- antiporter ClcA